MRSRGKVYLVGAGPGDPGLISLRGVQLLACADEVLYDYLVNPVILQHVRAGAVCVCLGSHSQRSIWRPEQIQQRMVESARQGLRVVRLKSGDPIVFGRASGELRRLADEGIEFEIVPGITAGLAAACCAGMPVTDRDVASAVAFVTGQENPTKAGQPLDYEALARFPGTLVFYMGVTTAQVWTSRLMAAGMPADCPVALVRRSTWPDQQLVLCRLDEVADRVTPYAKFPPPAVAIVGPVARHAAAWNWFERRPLFGLRVWVARPIDQAAEVSQELRELGADVIVQPAVEIESPANEGELDRQIERLSDYDVITFTSANGVRAFCDRLLRAADVRGLSHLQIAAVGPATVDMLSRYHLRADVVPDETFNAAALLQLLQPTAPGNRYLVVRGDRGRDTLTQGLRAAGAIVEEMVAYVTRDVSQLEDHVAAQFAGASEIWVTATSPSVARSIHRLVGDRATIRWASISPLTSATIHDLGAEVACEAKHASMDGLVRALVAAVTVDKSAETHSPAEESSG